MSDEKKVSVVAIEDLAGLSAPLTKLVEVIAAGMGNAYRPVGIVREGKAEATRLRALASAHADAIRISAAAQADAGREFDRLEREREIARLESVPDMRRRAEMRMAAEAVHQQENLERIAGSAPKYMPESVSEEDVNPDWRTLFFKHARDISDNLMREVWAQVLAGEVAKPGSYSLRTLEVLRLMSSAEAEAFARLCDLVFEPNYVVRMDRGLEEFGVPFNDIMALQAAGVLQESFSLSKKFPRDGLPTRGSCLLVTHDVGLRMELTRQIEASVYFLTRAGRELRRLVASKANSQYVAAVREDLSLPGCVVTPFPIEREGELIRAGGKLYRPDEL